MLVFLAVFCASCSSLSPIKVFLSLTTATICLSLPSAAATVPSSRVGGPTFWLCLLLHVIHRLYQFVWHIKPRLRSNESYLDGHTLEPGTKTRKYEHNFDETRAITNKKKNSNKCIKNWRNAPAASIRIYLWNKPRKKMYIFLLLAWVLFFFRYEIAACAWSGENEKKINCVHP